MAGGSATSQDRVDTRRRRRPTGHSSVRSRHHPGRPIGRYAVPPRAQVPARARPMGRPRCRKWAAAGVAGRYGGTSRGPPGVTPVGRRLSGRLVPKSTLDFTTTIYTTQLSRSWYCLLSRSAAEPLQQSVLAADDSSVNVWWSLNAAEK